MRKLLLITFSVLTYAITYAQNITTVAGGLGDGGPAINTYLNYPRSTTVDGSGNIYIADAENHRIRKVTASTGIISTVAGNGTASYGGDGSIATLAKLYFPSGVAVDGSGNIYIADVGNHRIRKVNASTGIISTVAGNGTQGYSGDGSTATSANLKNPWGVAVDGSGNIYIADAGNNKIRKVTVSTNIISTIAGNGTLGFGGDDSAATSANLNSPRGVEVDGSGNIYIVDSDNNRIRKVTASTGVISTIAGNGGVGFGGDDSAATSANLYHPIEVVVDGSGNIYIADRENHRIRKVTASTGIISTVAGNGILGYGGDEKAATSANLYYPYGVAIGGSGDIYIADSYHQRIRKVTASTGIISTVAGNGAVGFGGDGSAATTASLSSPSGVAVDGSGNIYIADYDNNRIRKVTASTGVISTVAGNGAVGFGGDGNAATSANLNHPMGVAIDSSGNIYIADYNNHRIRKVTASTGIISTVAGNGIQGYGSDESIATSAKLNKPVSVAVDGSQNIYFADQLNNRIRKVIASTGVISTVAGNGYQGYGGDGIAATSANIFFPRGLALDGSGNIYIVDNGNRRIRKVTVSTGVISTVAGNGASGYEGDGNAATSAFLYNPTGVTLDGSGNIYIADTYSHRIRKVTVSTGVISTIVGNGTQGYGGDGSTATSANLNNPNGIAVDGLGNIYIADADNHRIRKVIVSIDNNIIANSQTICAGSTPASLIGNTPLGGTGSYTFSWLSSTTSATTGFTAISSTNTINYSPGVLTQNKWFRRYVVSGIFTDTSVAVLIAVNPKPVTSNITGLANAAKLDTTSYSVNGLSGSVFNWLVSGATIQSGAGSNKIQVKWSTTGTQLVKVTETSNQGCIGTQKSLSVNVSPTIGMNELKLNNQVIIYPNPLSETIHITLLNNLKLEKAIIYDLVGNEIIISNKNEIDASSLKSGIYLIRIVDNNGNSYSQKLVKN